MLDLNRWIEATYSRDVLIAWAFVIGLWLAVIFVLFAMWDLVPPGPWRVVMLAEAVAVLLFNTAWFSAMLKHYQQYNDGIASFDNPRPDDRMAREPARRRNTNVVRAA